MGTLGKRRWSGSSSGILLALCTALALATPANADATDPLFVFSPVPPSLPGKPPAPPPTSYFDGPCGMTIDPAGNFWVSDYYHRSVDVFKSDPAKLASQEAYLAQPLTANALPEPHTGLVDDPCQIGLGPAGTLYLNNYHRDVVRFPAPTSLGSGTVLSGSQGATGVAVDPADGHAYANLRDHVSEYDASGAFVQAIGAASLSDGYGIAVSGYGPTAG